MKCVAVLLLSALIGEAYGGVWTRLFSIKESQKFTCPSDGFFPEVDSGCTQKYYYCSEGVSYPQTCPGTSAFSPVTNTCTGVKECHYLVSETTVWPTTAFPCPADGFFPASDECTADYYICVSGVSYPRICPCIDSCTVFDPVTSSCVALEEASCGKTTTEEPTTTTEQPTTTTEEPTTTTERPTTTTKEPTTTTKEPTTSTEPPTTTTEIPTTTPFSCPEMNGNFPIPGECTDYYLCIDGEWFVVSCPPGFAYNPETHACDASENVPGCSNVSENYSQ